MTSPLRVAAPPVARETRPADSDRAPTAHNLRKLHRHRAAG